MLIAKSKKKFSKVSSIPEKSKNCGLTLDGDNTKLYLNFRDMSKAEKTNPNGESFRQQIQGKIYEERRIIARKTTEEMMNRLNHNYQSIDSQRCIKDQSKASVGLA